MIAFLPLELTAFIAVVLSYGVCMSIVLTSLPNCKTFEFANRHEKWVRPFAVCVILFICAYLTILFTIGILAPWIEILMEKFRDAA